MTRSRALITSVFFISLAGAVGFAAYNSQQNTQPTLVPVENGTQKENIGPKLTEPSVKDKPVPKAIKWETSFEEAMKRAKKEGKPLFIDFYTDWCGPCKEMEKTVYPDKNVIRQSQNWVMVKIDGDKRGDVAAAYGVTGFPTVIFAESTGKPFDVMPGYDPSLDFVTVMQSAFSKWNPSTSA